MNRIPNWPWMRTQIDPRAKRVAWGVRKYNNWTLPGIYTFALHAMLMTHTPAEIADMIEAAVGPPAHPKEQPE